MQTNDDVIVFGELEIDKDEPCYYLVHITDGDKKYCYCFNDGNDHTIDEFLKYAKQENPGITENAVVTMVVDEKRTWHNGEMKNILYP